MSQPFIGEVRIFGGIFAPAGWAMCNGQIMSIAQNTALFSIVGTTFGGDGESTFGLPILQARAPIHVGQGPGLSNRDLGDVGGEPSVTLSTAQIPAHTHLLETAAAASTGTPDATVALSPSSNGNIYRPATNLVPMAAALSSTGSGVPHENRQPYLGLNFIIALQGIFPARN